MNTKRVRTGILAFAVFAAVSPVSISTARGLEVSQACADGTCCPEVASDCFINGIPTANAYKASKPGPCSGQQQS
jgi:hypothetical protein